MDDHERVGHILAVNDWSAVTAAGAFVVGIIVGGVAVARVFRAVMSYFRSQRDAD